MTALGIRPAPGCGDYLAAIQHPPHSFTVPLLQSAVLATDPLGLPAVASGASAVVFKATVGHGPEALRCYTNMAASNRERYERLGHHLEQRGPAAVARAQWLDDAIIVGGQTWPVLRMEWVEGRSLDRYVDFLVREGDTSSLIALSNAWLELCDELVRADFAHGDLQHGNVLVDDRGRLRLVDLDGVWIPELDGFASPSETGHPNYQHPSRRATRRWDARIDTFAALVVHLSLRAVAVNPMLWHELHDDEQLILSASDFEQPGRTLSWQRLAATPDPEVQRLAALLYQACTPDWSAQVTLSQLLAPPRVVEWWNLSPAAEASTPPTAETSRPRTASAAAAQPPSTVESSSNGLPWTYSVAVGQQTPVPDPAQPPATRGPLRPPESIAADLSRQAQSQASAHGPVWPTPPSAPWWPPPNQLATGGASGAKNNRGGANVNNTQPATRDALLMGKWAALAMLGLVIIIILSIVHGAIPRTVSNLPLLGLVGLARWPAGFVLVVGIAGFVQALCQFIVRSGRHVP